MGRRKIGIILLGALNILTFFLDAVVTWFFVVVFAMSFGEWTVWIVLISGIAVEVFKWICFYMIVKHKKTKWLIFYGVYSALIFLAFVLSDRIHAPILLIPFIYLLGIFLILSDHGQTEKQFTVEKDILDDTNEQTLQSTPLHKNRYKNPSTYFRIGLWFLFPPIMVLSYYTFGELLVSSQSMMSFILPGSSNIRVLILTVITIISWSVLIYLWIKGCSYWRYFFIVPMVYQCYLFLRGAATLKEFMIGGSFEIFHFPFVYLNVLSVILYAVGLTILHQAAKKFSRI